jgi:hypothetical protein
MAIRLSYTDPRTGAVYPQAHVVCHDPLAREETRQAVCQMSVYADQASYAAGLAPIGEAVRTLDSASYAPLRTATLDVIEPALIAQYGSGTRVPD